MTNQESQWLRKLDNFSLNEGEKKYLASYIHQEVTKALEKLIDDITVLVAVQGDYSNLMNFIDGYIANLETSND